MNRTILFFSHYKKIRLWILMVFFVVSGFHVAGQEGTTVVSPGAGGKWVLVIHGGAGNQNRDLMTEKRQQQYRNWLNEALNRGAVILRTGGSALDAVQAVVMYMEDCPGFNAGRGAVLDADGSVEMDASVMDGSTETAIY